MLARVQTGGVRRVTAPHEAFALVALAGNCWVGKGLETVSTLWEPLPRMKLVFVARPYLVHTVGRLRDFVACAFDEFFEVR
jgi:hypothetical protein